MLAQNTLALDPSIFRTYDIRGIVGEGLTEEAVFFIGKAIATLALKQGETAIAIGRDGRLSSPHLITHLCQGILSTGCDVINIGMVPTPVLYYATHVLPTQSGVMLTGSHNPSNYNGLKMVVKGKALAEEEIKGLCQSIKNNELASGNGKYSEIDLIDKYIEEVCTRIKLAKPLKIVIDAGNGVAGEIAPRLFKALGCDIIPLFCDIDGGFPNHHPDPSQVENLKDLIDAVKEHHADVGLAFDGDGDRLGVVTKAGTIIWPDRLLMLFSKALLEEHAKATIIFDVKCSTHLAHVIKAHGGEPIMWRTGHSLIKAKLAETQAQLAGEMSGHFFFKQRWFGFDDALYAGGRLLEILAKHNEDSEAIFAAIPNSVNTPELKVQVNEDKKFDLMQRLISAADFKEASDIVTIDGLRVNFTQGWGLVRPSNTTPYLILRFEANDEFHLANIQTQFRQWMLGVQPDLALPF